MTPSFKALVLKKSTVVYPGITPDCAGSMQLKYKNLGITTENARLLPLITQLAEVIEKMESALEFVEQESTFIDNFGNHVPRQALADLEALRMALANSGELKSSEAKELG
jgi:division protein CdvB (Snf7/Vps24/ESCRT-III family)